MKKIARTLAVLGLMLLIGCRASNKIVEPSAKSRAIDEMVEIKQIKFEAEWARPLATSSLNSVVNSGMLPPGNSASQINIMGNGSFLKMEGDSVSADLSYFGERRRGGGYNSNTGIKFEGVPEDLEIKKDEDKQRYEINFTISEQTETFQMRLNIFSNSKATVSAISSERTSIRYEGQVSELEKTEIQ